MSQQSQPSFPNQNGKHTPLFRRKRMLFAIVTGLIVLFLVLRPFPFTIPSKSITSVDELNGLLYMVSYTEHTLPPDLNTAAPIAPSAWVPRETFNSKLWQHRVNLLDDTPVVVFSKSYCPYSRRAKDLLARYNLKPAPKVVEVDLRDDGDMIKSLLIRLTNRFTFPNIILRGRSLGGSDNLQSLHESGALEHEFEKAGVHVAGDIHGDED